jgi:tRNA A37 threonylcarbamoyladenosine synthetase subunit TsaC/SUA5/YrdC
MAPVRQTSRAIRVTDRVVRIELIRTLHRALYALSASSSQRHFSSPVRYGGPKRTHTVSPRIIASFKAFRQSRVAWLGSLPIVD